MNAGGRWFLSVFACLVLMLAPVLAEVLPYSLKIEKVLDNTAELGDLAQSPTGELWLLERSGMIRVFQDGSEQASLSVGVSTACDSGLLDVTFAPDYARSGLAALSYVTPAGQVRVDEVLRTAGGLSLGSLLIDLGTSAGGCRVGGGLETSADGKLLVAVGDLGVGGDAQDDAKLAGKLLRANFDGSVPVDNPSGTLDWAKGFRHGADLATNPNTSRTHGTVYMTDRGTGVTVEDEVNAPGAGGNFGWDATSGNSGGIYDDPIISYNPVVGTEGLAAITSGQFGFYEPAQDGSLTFACTDVDEIRQAMVTGAEGDTFDSTRQFFNPEDDRDGTPDLGCPNGIHALEEGNDGWIYAANDGDTPGIWRIYNDTPGPREVSAPGSPFRFTVGKDAGSNLRFGWEDLGSLDAYYAGRPGNQHIMKYQIWEGSLPISSYDHTSLLQTDGTPEGSTRLTAVATPGGSDQYYLVTAQGDNMEGSAGRASSGDERNAATDYCADRGLGKFTQDCADDFRHVDSGALMKLTDYNPMSPTYLQDLSLYDFRGKVVHLDLSADDCFWCNVQADYFHAVDQDYRDRDFILLVIFTKNIGGYAFTDIDECATQAADWAQRHNEHTPILCDVPRIPNPSNNDERRGAVTYHYWHPSVGPEDCGGTPQNMFIDQDGVIYHFQCGAFLSSQAVSAIVAPEVNPETCE